MIARPDRQDPRLETHGACPGADSTWCGRLIRFRGPYGEEELCVRPQGAQPSCTVCWGHWWRLTRIFS